MFDLSLTPFAYSLGVIISICVAWGSYLTLSPKTGKLSSTAKWLVVGLVTTWIGVALSSFWNELEYITTIGREWWATIPMFAFSFMTLIGGLIHVQTLYAWKLGKYAWFKILGIATILSVLITVGVKFLF